MSVFRCLCFVIVLEMSFVGGFADELLPTLESTPDKAALQERIKVAEERLKRFPPGHIVIGQVLVEGSDDVEEVASQMLILKGGYFATDIKKFSKPLTFRAHQYAPLDLDLKGKEGQIVDVGVIKMRRLVPADLVPVQGKITLEGAGNPTQATVTFSVSNGPVNSVTNGTDPRPKWAESIELRVDSSGQFQDDSFSPITYYGQIKAPGYVSKSFSAVLNPRDRNDLGSFKLEKPRRVELEYVISKEGPFELDKIKKTALTGGARWKATPDIYGWDLEFTQIDGKLYFKHAYGPCSIEDLGEVELKEALEFVGVAEGGFPENLAVEDGHVYIVNQGHWKRKILMKAKLTAPE